MTGPFSDDFPVLLGPVRLETRFTATELLVRVFPDEWCTDMFEPRPTRAELDALDAYWTALWASGGDEAAERAAWHELVARVPAGRANWLLQSHKPANPTERPVNPAGTTVLVIVSAVPLPANDRQPAITYWTAIWRAYGDRVRIRDADLALRTAVGTNRANTIRGRRPFGADAAPASTNDAVAVAFLVLPQPAAADIAPQSWTTAARARLLPDRFTVLGYKNQQQVLNVTGATVPDTLAVSPDPAATDQLSVNEQTGALHIPNDLRWLTDFDRAVAQGVGVRIPLTDAIRDGLDRLVVLGLRRRVGPVQSGVDLADLITRQVRSANGFSLLPQGTPTNNTEQAPAGQDAHDEAEAGLRSATAFAATLGPGDWPTKTDGQWFAELLGIDPAVLTGVANADRTDQRDARAANTALWPATWGYYLETMLHPLISRDMAEQTRDFFTRHVSGRGPVPAVKIGRQPYGILPTTAFSRLAWPAGTTHRQGLNTLLRAAAEDWQAKSLQVARLGDSSGDGDPHQILLDILALHPTSAEYYQRYAQSVEDIFNRENLGGLGPNVLPALDTLNMPQPIRALLTRLGKSPSAPDPDLLRRLFIDAQYPLLSPLVDDRPLSETDPVRGYANEGTQNYLHWLVENGRTSLENIRLELGFDDARPPAALLYLLLRHAVLLGWEDTGRRLAAAAGSPVPSTADPLFVHISLADAAAPSESRFRQLYSPDQAITGDPGRLVVDHIPNALASPAPPAATTRLSEQLAAVELLADLPTARLERVLAEHLDLATYRLDAWRLGLVNERLSELRFGPAGTAPPKRGVHLGAYGWLEDVKPRTAQLETVQLTGQLAQLFGATVPHDPDNGGYVHAPSPSQASTAAVLRAGYVANGTPDNPGAFAVNLSSERVRVAITMLDGLRQGQSLGALLGYRFERGLHEGHPGVELDSLIPPLRGAFPLRAGRLPGATPGPDLDVKLVEARNVVDGLELVRRVTRATDPLERTYPFGLPLPTADQDQRAAIDAEVDKLLDIHDALADLAVAEGTHQALLGNPERASATLDAYAKEGLPPDPAVVATPRGGVNLTHRLGLVFDADPPSGLTRSPRARAEPPVNSWLSDVLPPARDVAVRVTWTDPVSGQNRSRVVTQDEVDLQPIDLLWALRPEAEAAMTDLDDRIVGVVVDRDEPRPDALLTIRYTQRVDGKLTFFELSALVAALRGLLTTSRPLRPTDLVPAAGVAPLDRAADDAVSVPRDRPADVREELDDLRERVADYVHDLGLLFPAPPAPVRRADVLAGIDTFLTRYAELVVTAGGFGMVRSGWGELTAWRRGVFVAVLAAVDETADRMNRSLTEANAIIAAYDALPGSTPAEEQFRRLRQAERLLTTNPVMPRPATPQQLRAIVGNRRNQFSNRLQGLRNIANTSRRTLSGLLNDVRALLPLTDFDPDGLDLTPFEDQVVTFATELLDRAGRLLSEVTDRRAAGTAGLTDYDKAETGPDRVRAALDALRAMIGTDVLLVPRFTPSDQLASDWRRAHNDSDDLVRHLEQDVHRDFPVDDWLHGIARVREKPRLWERVVMLSDALRGPGDIFGDDEPELTPVQFPYQQNDHWLGMEFAPGTVIDQDRLLFTAHYADNPSLGNDPRSGLLLDEWTEVVPATKETTGIAVNYDQPDSEPPQAMLLVAPPVRTGTWQVDDLVSAVNETFDLAKIRAVEPAHLDDTAYAHLLPATVMSATRQPITISTDLAIANLRWKARD
jgi:hypothetical protein